MDCSVPVVASNCQSYIGDWNLYWAYYKSEYVPIFHIVCCVLSTYLPVVFLRWIFILYRTKFEGYFRNSRDAFLCIWVLLYFTRVLLLVACAFEFSCAIVALLCYTGILHFRICIIVFGHIVVFAVVFVSCSMQHTRVSCVLYFGISLYLTLLVFLNLSWMQY